MEWCMSTRYIVECVNNYEKRQAHCHLHVNILLLFFFFFFFLYPRSGFKLDLPVIHSLFSSILWCPFLSTLSYIFIFLYLVPLFFLLFFFSSFFFFFTSCTGQVSGQVPKKRMPINIGNALRRIWEFHIFSIWIGKAKHGIIDFETSSTVRPIYFNLQLLFYTSSFLF